MDFYLILGILGMVLLLLSFLMNQLNKWNASDFVYDCVNCVGGIFLVIYAIPSFSWPFMVLNSIWAIFSFKDMIMDLRKKK